MREIIFLVEEAEEGVCGPRPRGSHLHGGETWEELKEMVRDAVRCHFGEEAPPIIRLHFVREEVLTP